jgi:CheY-like chemotaxis protein/MinD-like ATPase involved in chromosome partitioning or flagellar assembly
MSQQKILVVDDDIRLHRMMSLILPRAGYQVIAAMSGEEGVEKVRIEKPDLVLMDVVMPGMDGFEATQYIRQSLKGRHLPIIYLSAKGEVGAKMRGLLEGGDDYITKPVSTDVLLACIETHLQPATFTLDQLIIVFGSEAGVGVTTLVVDLALALRRVSQRDILLVDWRRPLGDVAPFLGLPETPALESLLTHLDELGEQFFADIVQEHSPGVWVLPGSTDQSCAEQMNKEALDGILKIALSRADYVLVDAGPFFSWETPPLVSREDGINLCVLAPETTAIEQAVQVTKTVNATEHDFWLILNRYSAQGAPPEQIESHLGTTLKGCVPEEGRVAYALDKGRSLYMSDPTLDFSRAMHDIATRIHEVLTV